MVSIASLLFPEKVSVILVYLVAPAIRSSSAIVSCKSSSVAAPRFSRRWPIDDAPGMRRMLGALKQPGQRDLHWRRPEGFRSPVERGRLERREPSEREVRHVGNALGGQIVDESFVAALGHVVEVLNADNLRDGLCLGQMPGRDCAEVDMLNETLLLQFSERG